MNAAPKILVITAVVKTHVAGETVAMTNPVDPSYPMIAFHQGHGGSMKMDILELI